MQSEGRVRASELRTRAKIENTFLKYNIEFLKRYHHFFPYPLEETDYYYSVRISLELAAFLLIFLNE